MRRLPPSPAPTTLPAAPSRRAEAPTTTSPTRLPTGFPLRLAPDTDRVLEGPALRRAAAVVGASCPSLAGVAGRMGQDTDVLVSGWAAGPALSSMPMMVVGRALSLVRLVMGGRKEAVTRLLDRERTRMAYALHDGLLQSVTGAVLELEALRSKIEQDPAAGIGAVEGSKAEIRRALADLRDILFGLSGDGEPGSPESFIQQVHDVLGRWSLPATVKVRGRLDGVPSRTLTVAYFVIRESVANAAKHSAAGDISVILGRLHSELRIEIADGGRGFTHWDERSALHGQHMGLEFLCRRVAEVGGSIAVDSRPGRGTRVVAMLPVGEASP